MGIFGKRREKVGEVGEMAASPVVAEILISQADRSNALLHLSEYVAATAEQRTPRTAVLGMSQAAGFTRDQSAIRRIVASPEGDEAQQTWRWLLAIVEDAVRLNQKSVVVNASFFCQNWASQIGARLDSNDLAEGWPPRPSPMLTVKILGSALPVLAELVPTIVVARNERGTATVGALAVECSRTILKTPALATPDVLTLAQRLSGG